MFGRSNAGKPRIFPEGASPFIWFIRHRFRLLDALVTEAPERGQEGSRARFERANKQAAWWLRVQTAVTILLVLGAITSVAGVVLSRSILPDRVAAHVLATLDRAAAAAGSFTVLLLATRFAVDRMLARYLVLAQYLAARL